MDYIFIIGPSAVGKTTLAKGLFEHYRGVLLEQNMVPEFAIPDQIDDPGLFEETLCWENVLPLIFKGSDYIILRLVSGKPEQIIQQMVYRSENEGGLLLPDYVERANSVIMERKLMPNEVMIDIAGKTKEEVLAEALRVIDGFHPMKEYNYEPDDEHHYLSWVQSRQLF